MKPFIAFLKTLLVVFLFFPLITNAQNNEALWVKINKVNSSRGEMMKRKSQPKNAHFYQLNMAQLKKQLKNAPLRGASNKLSNVIVKFPNADGNLEAFRVLEAPVMVPEMQMKHPDIRSYVGQSMEDPSSIIRFSVTPFGLHTMTLSSKQGTQFIDPYTKDGINYIVYSNRDLPVIDDGFHCGVTNQVDYSNRSSSESKLFNANDGMLRTYRLALACTAEYGNYHGGDVSSIQAAMAVTMTRVDGIYERDLSITMTMVDNTSIIYFGDVNADPYTNDDGSAMLDENQTEIDSKIGESNYDIGHVFSTGGGGIAGLGVVCVWQSAPASARRKARGVTGSTNPVGDAYDVDYVAHEMGHQFGANHTFNSIADNCGGQRNPDTAYEPGSGSTIMAYAGICLPENVQQNSDDYFHQASLQEIWAYVTSGPGSSCATLSATINNAPTANAGNDYTIPVSTPYKLAGSSTDDDGTGTHTYTWEEYDLSTVTSLPSETSIDAPIVRSFKGTTNPTRYIPRLADLRYSNGSTAWEKLSSVNRDINFQLTVRDNDSRGGQTATDGMTVSVTNSAGPFLVTSQNDGSSWVQNSTETITWDVANTDMAPLSVSNVNIWLSTDGGLTYNIPLDSNTPNDGTEDITVPNIQAPFCRVMVEAVGNIFFNINTVSFPIGYTIVNVCNQYNSTDPNLPITITDNGGNYTETTGIAVPDSGVITDVNVSVNIDQTWVGDLLVGVQSPDGTLLQLMYPYTPCQGEDPNLVVTFDDAGAAFDCSVTGDGLTMQSPISSLGDWNGEESSGTWILGLGDFGAGDIGVLNSWSLEICADIAMPLGVEDFSLNGFSVFPNPNKGNFTVKLDSVSNNLQIEVFDMSGRSLFYNSYKNKSSLIESIDLKNAQSGMYLVKVSDGDRSGVKKIVID